MDCHVTQRAPRNDVRAITQLIKTKCLENSNQISDLETTCGPVRVSASPATESYWPRELNGSLWFFWAPLLRMTQFALPRL